EHYALDLDYDPADGVLHGRDGHDGKDGRAGQACPDGYSLQAPSWDADALVCRRDGAPPPNQPGNNGNGNTPEALGLDPHRRQYP
ncbi:hypothetical protein ACFC5A_36335, partial [Streptomyces yangpuensis]